MVCPLIIFKSENKIILGDIFLALWQLNYPLKHITRFFRFDHIDEQQKKMRLSMKFWLIINAGTI